MLWVGCWNQVAPVYNAVSVPPAPPSQLSLLTFGFGVWAPLPLVCFCPPNARLTRSNTTLGHMLLRTDPLTAVCLQAWESRAPFTHCPFVGLSCYVVKRVFGWLYLLCLYRTCFAVYG